MPKRADSNQKLITDQLRRVPGISVALTHTIGKGFPDMIIGWKGQNLMVEIKDPTKLPSQRKLTDDEKKFHKSWTGKIIVAETIDDIFNSLNFPK